MKYFGIFVTYPPTVNLTEQGLGRYLAAFIRGAEKQEMTRFIIACPTWSIEDLTHLFKNEGVQTRNIEFIHTNGIPYLLRLHKLLKLFSTSNIIKSNLISQLTLATKTVIESMLKRYADYALHRLVSIKTLPEFILGFIQAISILALASPIIALGLIGLAGITLFNLLAGTLYRTIIRPSFRKKIDAALSLIFFKPQNSALIIKLYQLMHNTESQRLVKLINKRTDIDAWYCPTAFWPEFNKISAPRLMCVPDVLLSDFPIGFSITESIGMRKTFKEVCSAIQSSSHIVTYSNAIKTGTLINKFGIAPSRIHVIPHAPNTLHEFILVSGFPDNELASTSYCQSLVMHALGTKSTNPEYTRGYKNKNIRFIFYASQFRPNKNLKSLLLAYKHLISTKGYSPKLILTGNPLLATDIQQMIHDLRLNRDVICLPHLSLPELAAFYKLAELSVNPSLAEGGCPFTFTESLSVGTPVVMSDIPVTTEILIDKRIIQATCFDPYDWRSIAQKIFDASNNPKELLALQLPVYNHLSKRLWENVVSEHIDVLSNISASRQFNESQRIF